MTHSIFQTSISELFGIQHPILCGGLMWLSDARYVAAVVNGGAMGFITPRSFSTIDAFREELELCKRLTEGRSFGVNLYISGQDGRNDKLQEWIDVSLDSGVRHFETAGFSPGRWLPKLRESGSVVIHKCTTIRHAQRAERDGVDAVSLVGHECGGHPGQSSLSALSLGGLAASRLKIPYVIGGGIGSGAQIVSALSVGAGGVLIGSRMLVSDEIWAHRSYKEHLLTLDEQSTTTVLAGFGRTYRCLNNDTAQKVEALENEGITDFEDYRDLVRGDEARLAYESGDWTRGILSLGPAVSFANQIEPAANILKRLMDEATAAGSRIADLQTNKRMATGAGC